VIGIQGLDPSGERNRFFSQNSRAGKVVGKRLWRARHLKNTAGVAGRDKSTVAKTFLGGK